MFPPGSLIWIQRPTPVMSITSVTASPPARSAAAIASSRLSTAMVFKVCGPRPSGAGATAPSMPGPSEGWLASRLRLDGRRGCRQAGQRQAVPQRDQHGFG